MSGSGATGTATITGGAISAISVDAQGTAYTSGAVAIITGDGVGAEAEVVVTSGYVTSVNVTNGGAMALGVYSLFDYTAMAGNNGLELGSTPTDFAYAIHTEVGNHCVGAKVNGAIVPLTYELQLGDRVDILTQKSASPSRDWLGIVKTPSARSKIRSYFSKVSRSDDLQFGRDKLTREMRKHGLGISSAQSMRSCVRRRPSPRRRASGAITTPLRYQPSGALRPP